MRSLPVTPGRSLPSRTTLTVRGTCHQVIPVAQMAAASVRTTGVPTAPTAPYIFECESEATTRAPGWTNPFSIMSWWPMPAPAGWKCDAFLAGERLDLGVLLEVGLGAILDVVVEGEDRLPGIGHVLGADGAELGQHRSGVVVGHHVRRSDGDHVAREHLGAISSKPIACAWTTFSVIVCGILFSRPVPVPVPVPASVSVSDYRVSELGFSHGSSRADARHLFVGRK